MRHSSKKIWLPRLRARTDSNAAGDHHEASSFSELPTQRARNASLTRSSATCSSRITTCAGMRSTRYPRRSSLQSRRADLARALTAGGIRGAELKPVAEST